MTLRQSLARRLLPTPKGARGGTTWSTRFEALHDINLAARPGEIIGVIGRNGSGKSTLLKVLAGIIGPESGSVAITGRVNCLMSFGGGFNRDLTGRENVLLNGGTIGMSRSQLEALLPEIIEFSGIGDFIDAPVRIYSTGMRVRLGFALAIHMAPDVLLLDEVLSVGDAAFREKSGTIIEHLRDANRTIIIASHNLALMRTICDRVIWLDGGRIRREGVPADVCTDYAAESVALAEAARVPERAGIAGSGA